MKKFIIFSVCFIFFALKGFGQTKKSTLDYDKDTRWFWGVNAGVTWQNTDVKTKKNWGYGLILGKSFNYDYGKAISFDIRSRFLSGSWIGQNTFQSDTTISNTALSSENSNYKDSLGFYVLNFKTALYSFDLEFVLHSNSLRERTGWDLFAFGGIGLSSFKTKGDLLDNNNAIYNYNELKDYNSSTISNFKDNTFESNLDGSLNSSKFNLMTSVGVGLGYQLTRNISFGVEHRMTFSRLDHFDGYNDPNGYNNKTIRRENDIFHYSSAYLRFQIHHNRDVVKDSKDETKPSDVSMQQAPVISIENPISSGTTSSSSNYTIKANISSISSKENISFKHNGVYSNDFTYQAQSNKFESNVTLFSGQNILEINASNSYGSNQKSTIIVYKETQEALPIVHIFNPDSNPYHTYSQSISINASIINIIDQSQVNVILNDKKLSNYSYSNENGILTINSDLAIGTNVFKITANNQKGSDIKTLTIIYDPEYTETEPVVYFIDPNHSPFTSETSSILVSAEVLNIYGKENITFKHNGVVNQNFSFQSNSNLFESSVVLVPGKNIFEIIASNSSSHIKAKTVIKYEKEAPTPPIISITSPYNSPYSTESDFLVFNASILNVTNDNQIHLVLNGQQITDFEYDSYSNTINTILQLKEGLNNIKLKANNQDGKDEKLISVLYQENKTIHIPKVTFVNPESNPYTSIKMSQKISALILNIDKTDAISVIVNGKNTTDFTFNNNTKKLNLTLNLEVGANVITVTGSNSLGTDSKTTTIIYKKADEVELPFINFINPIESPTTVNNQNQNIKAKVKGVKNKQGIQVLINGISTTEFNYKASTEIVTINSSLLIGANIFEIIATNSSGQDKKSTTIVYKVSEPLSTPIVTIINPFSNQYQTANSNQLIEATVLNISGLQNIVVKINNQQFDEFNFNNSTKKLSFSFPLNEGENKVKIIATNAAGNHSDTRVINYKKEYKIEKPIVSITKPNQTGLTVTVPNLTLKATILNIENSSQIAITQNGQIVDPQLYSYNSNTKELKFISELKNGNNNFKVKATNVSGNHIATTSIIYKKEVVPCEKPVITFINPAQSGVEVIKSKFNLKFKTTLVNTQNQIEISVNGLEKQGIFNETSKVTTLELNLNEGQNILEISAKNNCGESKATTFIVYKPEKAPCSAVPSLQLIQPLENDITTNKNKAEVRLGIINIVNKSDIIFKVNGIAKPFQFDISSKVLISNVQLSEGLNTVDIQCSNECGSSGLIVKINKISCVKPDVSFSSTSLPNNASTSSENFTIQGSITHVESNTDISVTNNGKEINFIFRPNLKTITINTNLFEGENNFVVKATNSCGEDAKTITIFRKQEVKINPPVIEIINPEVTPFATNNASFNVQATTKNIHSANQVSLSVNNQIVNFEFNPQNGSITYNLNLKVGNNIIIATAINEFGNAKDSKTIVYTKKVTLEKPEISLFSPSTCPSVISEGLTHIKGQVKNISSSNQITIKLNDIVVSNLNPVIIDNKLNFQFDANITSQTKLTIVATNSAGTDQKACMLKLNEVPPTDCKPNVSATFSGEDKNVTVVSTKELKNVVLKYHDGSVQKFDNLSGLTKTFTASGLFAGKCIIGVWIKSGCNQSSDGPGYGEFVSNPNQKVSCLAVTTDDNTNCKPIINVKFSTDSKSLIASSDKKINNIVLKYFDGSVEKINNITEKTKSVSGSGENLNKCIVGAWIKSGCNLSNEGSGYGEFFQNKSIAIACTNPLEGCLPTVNAMFSSNSKSVTVSSSKDLTNVVLKYHDGQEQKFPNLTGFTKTLSGTGINKGKCIVGVYIKSGCNKNNDGPGYGEWVANPKSTTICVSDDDNKNDTNGGGKPDNNGGGKKPGGGKK
jgi:hypothetical protein